MNNQLVVPHVIGFPRLGAKRELKWSLEKYWSGKTSVDELHASMAALRRRHWQMQADAGMGMLASGDFAYYDHILELSEALGVVPERHENAGDRLARCFAMARGGEGGQACEMKKWFNTNYHYLVPEFDARQQFACAATGAPPPDVVDQCREAGDLGVPAKAVITGPLTYLYLGKLAGVGGFVEDKLSIGDELAEAYSGILARLHAQKIEWLQLDEPVLSLDLPPEWVAHMEMVYETLLAGDRPQLLVANSYGSVGKVVDNLANLAIEGLHIDLCHGGADLDFAHERFAGRVLSVGAIDGRNVWRANLPALADKLGPLAERDGGLWVGSSCSMMHVPMDAAGESALLDKGLPLAFAKQKLEEIAALARTLSGSATESDRELFASSPSHPVADPGWLDEEYAGANLEASSRRGNPGMEGVPFPTTTIGSLPQTSAIRSARAAWRKGELDDEQYEQRMRDEIKQCVKEQEELGLDLLVHGECERNDMVEYFALLLDGVDAPLNGWVQSYGSRATRPPIIHGDIARPQPMTVRWSSYAAGLTDKPMKAMLTGPITIICWAFPRPDVPRMRTAYQIAEALRDETADLAAAGLQVIQVDEPALREGLPLAVAEREQYLAQAVGAFNRIVEGCQAQIHTHMCYGELDDIAQAIVAMDADVISLETSRTDMSVLHALADIGYHAGVGPGVYDVHSPRVPSVDEMEGLLNKALDWVKHEALWVNPDCGLKTRGWEETRGALANMVAAAARLRQALNQS